MISKDLDDLAWDSEPNGPGLYLARSLKGQVMICDISGEPGSEEVKTSRGKSPISVLQGKGIHFAPIPARREGVSVFKGLQKAWREVQQAKEVAATITEAILTAMREQEIAPEMGLKLLGLSIAPEDLPAILAELGVKI